MVGEGKKHGRREGVLRENRQDQAVVDRVGASFKRERLGKATNLGKEDSSRGGELKGKRGETEPAFQTGRPSPHRGKSKKKKKNKPETTTAS